jgi:hypothetical protein
MAVKKHAKVVKKVSLKYKHGLKNHQTTRGDINQAVTKIAPLVLWGFFIYPISEIACFWLF